MGIRQHAAPFGCSCLWCCHSPQWLCSSNNSRSCDQRTCSCQQLNCRWICCCSYHLHHYSCSSSYHHHYSCFQPLRMSQSRSELVKPFGFLLPCLTKILT